jgi:hypothetical protein
MLTVFLLFSLLTLHPVHVSVTEITHDEKEKELEIISRIFIDDLQAAIRETKNDDELNLLEPSPGGVQTTDQLVKEYLQTHFKISLDGKPQSIFYLGHEVEGDAMLCYLQVKNVKRWKTIEAFNSVITELYDDQSNLVHVTVRNEVKSLRLMRDTPSGKLTFDLK